jgi:hypothetical protein
MLLALAATSIDGAALASRPGCTLLAVEAAPEFLERFPDSLQRVRNELRSRTDIDPCARVELGVGNDRTISVAVALPDGRTASRRIANAEDLIPTLEGLLLVPDSTAPTAVATDTAPAARVIEARPVPVRWSRAESPVAAQPSVATPNLGFELSAVTGARVGDGQVGYGAGLLSFIRVSGWLIGFQGRADGYRALRGSDPETALELAILTGHRFDWGQAALDLCVGSAIVVNGVSLSQTQTVRVEGMSGTTPVRAPEPTEEPSSSGPVPRLLLGARLGMNRQSVVRTFIGIDGEWGPRASMSTRGDASSPQLPRYSVGIALGATVGTL